MMDRHETRIVDQGQRWRVKAVAAETSCRTAEMTWPTAADTASGRYGWIMWPFFWRPSKTILSGFRGDANGEVPPRFTIGHDTFMEFRKLRGQREEQGSDDVGQDPELDLRLLVPRGVGNLHAAHRGALYRAGRPRRWRRWRKLTLKVA